MKKKLCEEYLALPDIKASTINTVWYCCINRVTSSVE